MADSGVVEQAIADLVASGLYASGTSTVGVDVDVRRGWLTESVIKAAVDAQSALVRVVAVGGLSSDNTRYMRVWDDEVVSPTLTAEVGAVASDTGLVSYSGMLALLWPPSGYPTVLAGLVEGQLWCNSTNLETSAVGLVNVVGTPSQTGVTPVLGFVTAEELLEGGGEVLPLTAPSVGLWNDNQVVKVVDPSEGGRMVRFAGTPVAGQVVGVTVGGELYTYSVLGTDTLATVAAALAALVPGGGSSGEYLYFPATGEEPSVYVSQTASSEIEVSRMQQEFQISLWAPTPASRDAISAAVVGTVGLDYRLALGSDAVATMTNFRESGPDDTPARAQLWRKNFRVSYDYPVFVNSPTPTPTMGVGNLVAGLQL